MKLIKKNTIFNGMKAIFDYGDKFTIGRVTSIGKNYINIDWEDSKIPFQLSATGDEFIVSSTTFVD